MDALQIFIAIAIIVLGAIAAISFFIGKDRRGKRLSPLAGLAFAFVVAGIVFGEQRLVGYSLMGIGLVLAIIDVVIKKKRG
jgi:hypothetical protein